MNNVLRAKIQLVGLLEHSAEEITTLAGLHDVDLNDLQNGQLLRYNSENEKFENFTLDLPEVPVQDVEVGGISVVNAQGVAEITLPEVPVQDVEVGGVSVVNAQGVAEITLPEVPVQDVEVGGVSVVNAQGVAEITIPDAKHNYSTTEQVIGTWIDNKPLYEKTIPFSNLSSGVNTVNLGISNTDTVIRVDVTALTPSNAWVQTPMTFLNTTDIGLYGAILDGYNQLTGNLTITLGSSRTFVKGYVIIQYTKTTD